MEPPSQLAGVPGGGATPGVEPDSFDESQPVPASTVTLVEGATFTICGPDGDVDGSGVAGLFVGDTRICSRLVLSIDGDGVEPLTLAARSPSSATFVGRTFDKRLLVFRDLWVGQGMRIDLRIRNLAREVRPVTVRLSVEADLAELFAVKKGAAPAVETPCIADGGELRFDGDGRRRGLIVHTTGEARTDDGCAIVWEAELQPRQTWTACVELRALRGGEEVSPTYPCGQAPELTSTTTSRLGWRRRLPQLATDVPGLARAFSRTGEDLGALQLADPDHPEDLLVAAGAPWYMTLFGRDSILTSWMALLLDPTLGLGTARSLARMQGHRDVAESDEQPGRILHEIRFSRGPSLALADGDIYYGSADVTPLFVMLVHELWRWGAPIEQIQALRPAVEAALAWLEGPGDPDGDGYIEYAPRGPGSLGNQGWKDSHDAVAFADGRLAEAPIAIAEVQAYAYGAWRAAAALAAADGDEAAAASRHARADDLQARFERDFWLPDREAFAIALDREKRPVDAIASNMGHCLWAGIVADPDKAAAVARLAGVAGAVHRLGDPHARDVHGPLQPAQLSQRVGVAARHRDLRRGAPPLRLRRGGAPRRGWAASRDRSPRRATAGTLRRPHDRRDAGAGAIPHFMLAAGMGVRRAIAGRSGAPRVRARRAERPDRPRSFDAGRVDNAEADGHAPRGRAGGHRCRRRRRRGLGVAKRARIVHPLNVAIPVTSANPPTRSRNPPPWGWLRVGRPR